MEFGCGEMTPMGSIIGYRSTMVWVEADQVSGLWVGQKLDAWVCDDQAPWRRSSRKPSHAAGANSLPLFSAK